MPTRLKFVDFVVELEIPLEDASQRYVLENGYPAEQRIPYDRWHWDPCIVRRLTSRASSDSIAMPSLLYVSLEKRKGEGLDSLRLFHDRLAFHLCV